MNSTPFYFIALQNTTTKEYLVVQANGSGSTWTLSLETYVRDPYSNNFAQIWVYFDDNSIINLGASNPGGGTLVVSNQGVGRSLALVEQGSAGASGWNPTILGPFGVVRIFDTNGSGMSWNDWGGNVNVGDMVSVEYDAKPNSAWTLVPWIPGSGDELKAVQALLAR